jgi:hypothetical protein
MISAFVLIQVDPVETPGFFDWICKVFKKSMVFIFL